MTWAPSFILPVDAAAAPRPGDAAPFFGLRDSRQRPFHFDERTTGVVFLVFSKPTDQYTSKTLGALDRMFHIHPKLARNVRRCLVLSRFTGEPPSKRIKAIEASHPAWTVLPDRDGKVYRAYEIIATPTVVVIGADRKIAAVHPGYDPGLAQRARLDLARIASVRLPPATTGRAARPNMTLQLGRSLAARGLWERALVYYRKAMERGPLPNPALLELAEIYVETRSPDAAIPILTGLAEDPALADDAAALLERARSIKEHGVDPKKRPRAKSPDTGATSTARNEDP